MIHRPELSVLDGDIGAGSTIHAFVWLGSGASIGRDCRVQAFAFIPPGVTIGDRVFIGPRVTFTNDRHPPSPRDEWEPTYVEDDAVIGAGAVILPGVTIGRGAFVGAGAVVTRDVPAFSTFVGVPARALHPVLEETG